VDEKEFPNFTTRSPAGQHAWAAIPRRRSRAVDQLRE
jgi:hypothetical protein